MVAKGFNIEVTKSSRELPFRALGSADLHRMARLVDDRAAEAEKYNWNSTLGVVEPPTEREEDGNIITARLIPPIDRIASMMSGCAPESDVLTFAFRYPGVSRDLVMLEHMNRVLSTQGFTIADLHFALDSMSCWAESAWEPPLPETLWRSGYLLSRTISTNVIGEVLTNMAENRRSKYGQITLDGWRNAVHFLDAGQDFTPLDLPLAQRPLRFFDRFVLYDALHANLGGPTLWNMRVNEMDSKLRATAMEKVVHEAIGIFGKQPWANGRRLRVAGRDITDVDASVVVGSTLIAIDCYASAWSGDLDRGLHSNVANRLSSLRQKLSRWHDRWREICELYSHVIPDCVERVLPLVVSTQAEWIDHDMNPKEWLCVGVPRFCTLNELTDFLQSACDIDSNECCIAVQR